LAGGCYKLGGVQLNREDHGQDMERWGRLEKVLEHKPSGIRDSTVKDPASPMKM